jgi:hypothetical protein
MADRTLFVSWGAVARGREQRALELFNEVVGYYGGLEQDGRIERFDVVLMEPNGFTDGFIVVHGTHAQLDAVHEDDRFRRLNAEASLVVDELRLIDGRSGTGIAETMALYQEAIAAISQPAHA